MFNKFIKLYSYWNQIGYLEIKFSYPQEKTFLKKAGLVKVNPDYAKPAHEVLFSRKVELIILGLW